MEKNTILVSRTITLNLSDEDCKAFCEKAAAADLSPSELLENFICDLVHSNRSNGSDERMHAEEWYSRCGFSQFADRSLYQFLLDEGLGELGEVETVVNAYDNIILLEQEIETTKQSIATGGRKGKSGYYTWRDIENSDGTKAYASMEEWVESEKEYLEQQQEELEEEKNKLNDYWNSFVAYTNEEYGTIEEEIEKLRKKLERYELF